MIKALSSIAHDWAVRCFGHEHVADRRVRALRILEEAVELAQSVGVEREASRRAVDVVYSRPPGRASQEIGGVMLTTVIFCRQFDADSEALLLAELRRVLEKSPEHFAERNRMKNALGLDGSQ
jgi:NTP pyrophosphatase (non-canonical NTP hydrolase)